MIKPYQFIGNIRRGIICGTGPSLTPEVIESLKHTRWPLFGCNNTYQELPLSVLLSCNPEWWEYYWNDPALRDHPAEKWTWDKGTADKLGINYIRGEWMDGFSTDPNVISYGHSSGYQLCNLALHYGVKQLILIGFDMKFPGGYDGIRKKPGSGRHYFGEYPPDLVHWTKVNVGDQGELNGLLECYATVDCEALGIEIINCSPGTALDCFGLGELEDYL
jgi:hypothetical protein